MSTTIQHGTGHTARRHHVSPIGIVGMLAALAVAAILAATVSLRTEDSPSRVDPVLHLGPNAGIAPDVINNQPGVPAVPNRGPNADLAPTWSDVAPSAAPLVSAGPNLGIAPDVVNHQSGVLTVPSRGPNADLAPDRVGREG